MTRARRSVFAILGTLALGLAVPAVVLAGAPTADNKPSESTAEDTTGQITLTGGDPDGDAVTFVIGTGPMHGSLGNFGSASCDTNVPSSCSETVDYTPDANYNGADSFTYHTNDGTSDSGDATVSITISAVNDAPTAANKTPSTNEDTLVQITMSGTDVDGDGLTFAVGTSPSHGTLANFGSPSCAGTPSSCTETVDYTPDADYNGPDSFTYTTNDGTIDSSAASVSITINAVNDPPSFTKGGDQTVSEDSGAASVPGWATNPSVGPSNESTQTYSYVISSNTNTALFAAQPAVATNGTLTFTPAANRFGTATVGVKIQDSGTGTNQSAEQTFLITVTAVDDPPNAVNDTGITITENAAATAINVLANDTYLPDGVETLTITAVTQAAHGTVTITGGGTGLTYQPASLYLGTDQFTYTIQDSGGTATDQATVALTVGKDTTGPVATAPVESLRKDVTMSTGTTIGIHLAWSATDTGVGVSSYQLQQSVDGGAYTTITLPTAGTKSINRSVTVAHTYRYRVRAKDKNGNYGSYKYGPSFKVYRFQDSSASIVYGGTWATASSTNYSGGTTHYAGTALKSATLTTTGRDFAIVGPVSSTRGSFKVYLDGVLQVTVSETSSTALARQVLWVVHFATSGSHTIGISVVGPARVDLDCILVLR